ncbi:MAG: NAD(P)-binding domain-containing protein [Planctomycetaceae bacterium]|nr:NAD(P)-binding domain-containing protein [Planctomycetaceae bacterium]
MTSGNEDMSSQSDQPNGASVCPNRTQVVIVGAGPIGLELAVECTRRGIAFETLDSGSIGHTISWWAPETRWFSSNERIAIAGVPLLTRDQTKATREEYLTYLRGVVEQFGFPVHCYQRVVDIRHRDTGFTVISESHAGEREVECEAVVLAVGGLDHPQRLSIEGEDLPHVDSYLREPHRYYGRNVLIVGGRNSAAEAALRLHHAGAHVSLSYRGPELPEDHIKYWLLPEIRGLIRTGRITGYFGTRPIQITPTHVVLETQNGSQQRVAAEDVLTLIGYVQDKTLFRKAGIELVGEPERPQVNEDTMETNVRGIYIAGTAIAGSQRSDYKVFLENCHQHVEQILAHLTGTQAQTENPEFQEIIQDAPES